jgi:hypothetical protein
LGPLYRIDTHWLDDGSIGDVGTSQTCRAFRRQAAHRRPPRSTRRVTSTSAAPNRERVIKITPMGKVSTLIQDPRLLWVDAMWIDDAGDLWMPTAQLNRRAPFQGGTPGSNSPCTCTNCGSARRRRATITLEGSHCALGAKDQERVLAEGRARPHSRALPLSPTCAHATTRSVWRSCSSCWPWPHWCCDWPHHKQ